MGSEPANLSSAQHGSKSLKHDLIVMKPLEDNQLQWPINSIRNSEEVRAVKETLYKNVK